MSDRLFAGVFTGGIGYADRTVEVDGDYKSLGFLSFGTLALTIAKDCPPDLRAEIEADAAKIQARRGEEYVISTCGQTVTLGHALVYDTLYLGPREYGNDLMHKLAVLHFAVYRDCLFVEVHEHGGWFLGFRRDGSIWSTANDRAVLDAQPKPDRWSGREIRRQ